MHNIDIGIVFRHYIYAEGITRFDRFCGLGWSRRTLTGAYLNTDLGPYPVLG
jgi:hypothetical protein